MNKKVFLFFLAGFRDGYLVNQGHVEIELHEDNFEDDVILFDISEYASH